jgi:hypothetical protein
MEKKECGRCSLCCKLINVPGLANEGEWCEHVNLKSDKGCSIYKERLDICKGFNCLWLQSSVLGNQFRPDKCGIIFEVYNKESFVVALVDHHKPNAWKKGEPARLIYRMLADGYFVWVKFKKETHLLLCKDMKEDEAINITKKCWKRKMGKIKNDNP